MRYALIDTDLGLFGLGWSVAGVARMALPDAEAGHAERFRRYEAAEPNPDLKARVTAYAAGEEIHFDDVPLDLGDVGEFERQVYAIARAQHWGTTTSYGDIARKLGDVALSRAVGQALGRNPIPLIIPCHRVLAANDSIGGFSAPGGRQTKRRMLALERASLPSGQFSLGI